MLGQDIGIWEKLIPIVSLGAEAFCNTSGEILPIFGEDVPWFWKHYFEDRDSSFENAEDRGVIAGIMRKLQNPSLENWMSCMMIILTLTILYLLPLVEMITLLILLFDQTALISFLSLNPTSNNFSSDVVPPCFSLYFQPKVVFALFSLRVRLLLNSRYRTGLFVAFGIRRNLRLTMDYRLMYLRI
ncbi:hypothetical protein LXL04_002381 [Taraxacum kok-saghyz]